MLTILSITLSGGLGGLTSTGAADLRDALAVDEPGAIQKDPARGIHGDDDGVLDEDHGRSPGEHDTRLLQEVLRRHRRNDTTPTRAGRRSWKRLE